MSVRLFHAHARLVVPLPGGGDPRTWIALHRRPVAWSEVFRPALALVGLPADGTDDALHFGAGGAHTGSLLWTRGAFWTTIRLRLPPCSAKKASLLANGLLKAARYAAERGR